MAKVKAETLSDMVPEDMIVDMNLCVEEDDTVDSYEAASASRRVCA